MPYVGVCVYNKLKPLCISLRCFCMCLYMHLSLYVSTYTFCMGLPVYVKSCIVDDGALPNFSREP